jgi:hypothetical protein
MIGSVQELVRWAFLYQEQYLLSRLFLHQLPRAILNSCLRVIFSRLTSWWDDWQLFATCLASLKRYAKKKGQFK